MHCHLKDTEMDIRKKGRCRGETFKDREELHCFDEGIPTAMKKSLKFFKIAGGAYIELVDVNRTTVVIDYQPDAEASKE